MTKSYAKMITHIFFASVVIFFATNTQAEQPQPIKIELQTSETLSLVYFAQSITGTASRSPYLRQMYLKHAASYKIDSTWLVKWDKVMRSVPPSVVFYPQRTLRRQNAQNFSDILEITALHSKDLNDFGQRTRALMPIGQHHNLMTILRNLEPMHRKHIWQPSQPMLNAMKTRMLKAQKQYKVADFLTKARTFYGSVWPASSPLVVGLVPVPGKRNKRVSFAHSAGAYAIVEVHQNMNIIAMLGVLVHEVCHSLFDAQPASLQKRIEKGFYNNQTLSAHLAYQEINEAVATALGNGLFEHLHRPANQKRKVWYNDTIIDAYAKAVHPDVVKYINAGKPWDAALSQQMVKRFETTFPSHAQDHRFVFQNAMIFVDASKKVVQHAQTLSSIFRRVTKVWFSSPANHPQSIQNYLGQPNATALFFLFKSNPDVQLAQYPFFKPIWPSIQKAMAQSKPFIYATRGQPAGRLNIVVWMAGQSSASPIYKKLKSLQPLPMNTIIWLP